MKKITKNLQLNLFRSGDTQSWNPNLPPRMEGWGGWSIPNVPVNFRLFSTSLPSFPSSPYTISMSEKVQSNIKDKGVRYFSNTASFYVSKNVSKTTNKSLKLDSPIFNNLNIIIRKKICLFKDN